MGQAPKIHQDPDQSLVLQKGRIGPMIAEILVGIGPETIEGLNEEARINHETPLGKFALEIIAAIKRYENRQEGDIDEPAYIPISFLTKTPNQ